jgi:hypothetical protein
MKTGATSSSVRTFTEGDLDSVVYEALRALAAEHAQPIAKAAEHVPRRPGLYAIHAGPKVWLELALGEPPNNCPFALVDIEHRLLQMLLPPLNLAGVVTPWTSTVKAARKVMADQGSPGSPIAARPPKGRLRRRRPRLKAKGFRRTLLSRWV